MAEKLLEKSRNVFLSLTPPENLIPKKRVKTSKKNRHWNYRVNNSGASFSNLDKFFHKKRHIASIHITKKPNLENLSLENSSILAPVDHNAIAKLHFTIGGNINKFLKTDHDEVQSSETSTSLLKKSTNESQQTFPLSTPLLSSSTLPMKKRITTKELMLATISPFYLKWNQESFSLTDFIKGRLYENIWNSLFSSYDLNYAYNTESKNYRSPIRIKNQHKNELMEYRKIAIFYGNLSRNSLTCLMQRSGASKFLSTLERRLDVALKRALFFPSIWAARQWIHQGKILVNDEICIYNSYLLQPGDLISIKEKYRSIWKKEWFKNFSEIMIAHGQSPCDRFDPLKDTNIPQKENPYNRSTPLINPRGRFLFPPHLMRKWDKWCQLWGNSIPDRKDCHLWSKEPYTWNLSLHPSFNYSVCANSLYLKSFMQLKNNLHKLRYTHRQPTPILFWLEELYKNFFPKKNQRHHMYQLISSLLLLQQRGCVIDGLFQQRWNRLFTKKKPKILKKKNCQWGGIKPMHLECSYSCATVIYLFTPQKLVWPSHINVLLLKSILNG